MAPIPHSEPDSSSEDNQQSPQEIRAELARVLESPLFKATPRRREMLVYVVEEMLAGRSREIKGYSIGISVFGKGNDFDPNSDPLVRLEARRLRHDLDSYYVSEGRANPLRITIPTGRYVPEIILRDVENNVEEGNEISTAPEPGNHKTASKRRSHWLAGALMAAIVMAALGVWILSQRQDGSKAELQIPAIAVLPFDVLSRNENDEYFATGLASRIVTDLSRFPDIRIYLPQTDFAQYATADPVELGKQMGVAYIVSGELRSFGSSINVAARLIDTNTSRILWTETYDQNLVPEKVMVIESEIAASIASTLGQPYGIIRAAKTGELADQAIPSLPSYECILRGYHFRRTFTPSLFRPTLACVEKAVQTDPGYAEAWAMLGFLHFISTALSIIPSDPDMSFTTASEAALHSIALDPNNVLGLKVLSAVNHYQGNYAESERYIRLALDINPNDPDTLYALGWRLAIRGRFEEGIPLLQRAIDRTVNPPGTYFHLMAIDSLMKKDGEGMLAFAKHASVDGSAISQSLIAMANGLLGDQRAAALAIERMNGISPGYDPIDRFRGHQATDGIIDAMIAALDPWSHDSGADGQE